MNIIDNLRKNILYFFTSLPFVIVLYEIIMTLTLANRGYAILLLGQLGFVPIAIILGNIIFMSEYTINIVAILAALTLLGGIGYGMYYGIDSAVQKELKKA
jgi:hypothetical protein